MRRFSWFVLLALIPIAAPAVTSVEIAVTAATPEVEQAMKAMKVPAGFTISPFAVDNQVSNPVAICVDDQDRVFVAETFRFEDGVSDNRQASFWLNDDLAAQSVDDRLAYYRKFADKWPGGAAWFTNHADQVRLLADTNGDGRADVSKLFAPDFRDPADGLGSGVIARDGDVWYTNIPHLWRLRDADGDGLAESREKLLSGFGVRTAFLGHDLHGLTWGPDGRLYFSIGDRGYNLTSKEGKVFHQPGRGAVFRCEPDGSGLEVFYFGLRNPQELAFNERGDLFTGDNNSDSGDKARIVYLLEGGDAGWNMEYQYMEGDYSRGPFNAEKVWHPLSDENRDVRPAHLLPPMLNLSSGPSGLLFVPGPLLGDALAHRFLMCDYTGSPAGSKTWSFAVEPDGAGYRVQDPQVLLQGLCNTDVELTRGGDLLVSDWIIGWKGTGKGRVYRLSFTAADAAANRATAALFAQRAFQTGTPESLAALLAHTDMRVRLRAQDALARRGADGVRVFTGLLAQTADSPARRHAVWGLGQAARLGKDAAPLQPVLADLGHADAEIRAQAARVLGEGRVTAARDALIRLLADASPRVRTAAAIALGKLADPAAVPGLLAVLRENADRDWYLRHAAVMGLAGCAKVEDLAALAKDASFSVRMGALLALGRSDSPRVADFLGDADLRVVTQAARFIYDRRLEGLSALAARHTLDLAAHPALARRVIAAARRTTGGAEMLAVIAADPAKGPLARRLALQALVDWRNPSPRDAVTGKWWPAPAGDEASRLLHLQKVMDALLQEKDPALAKLVAKLSAETGLAGNDPDALLKVALDGKRDAGSRLGALAVVMQRGRARADEALRAALADPSAEMRAGALPLIRDSSAAVEACVKALKGDAVRERQAALRVLAGLQKDSPAAAAVVREWAERLAAGSVPAPLLLEVRQAAEASPDAAVKARVEAWARGLTAAGGAGEHAASLEGGDTVRGRAVFEHHPVAQCLRCHLDGGGIGPDLRGLGKRLDRALILEGIVNPNARVAAGYGMTSVTRRDGSTLTGVQKEERPDAVVIALPDGKSETIARADIQSQIPPASVMPPMGAILTPGELRDLVEYLATAK